MGIVFYSLPNRPVVYLNIRTMIQDTITFLLIAASAVYVLYSLYRIVLPSKKVSATQCGGCTGCQFKKQ
jgi:hypothetical protein